MEHVISDWTRSDSQELGTYRGFVRMAMFGTVFLIVLLILMALFLL